MPTDDADDFGADDEAAPEPAPAPVASPAPVADLPVSVSTDEDVDPVTGLVLSSNNASVEDSGEIILPWMKFHEFHLVETAQELEKIVDLALAHGSCALDLETEGFDNRINYDADGKPHTVHQIVGACLSVKGVGYYVPVRHEFNAGYDEPDPNIPIPAFERALSRLCKAAQPELTPEGLEEDPLGSPKIAKKGLVVIKFWNAKFDQEFLYPVTGVDYWHPQSFEDGMLIRYVIYTDDMLGLKYHAQKKLRVKDPKTGHEHPYEMIKFSDLFKKETKKADRKIQTIHPHFNKNVTRYGCSDAICTELLVDLSLPELAPVKGQFTYLLEKHTSQVVRQMERTRTKIDRATVAQVLEEAEKELQDLDHKIKALAASHSLPNFNPASTAQLSEFLFGEKYLNIDPKPPMTEGGQYKTDADTLESMLEENSDAPPVLQWILHFRQIQRIIGTYLNRFLSDADDQDQLRFNFNQVGAQTGRFTAPAGEPDHGFFGGPIQGIPARDDPKKPKVAGSLRRVFVARPGYTLVKCDYAGQELRVVANVSEEPLWINEFMHGSGDLHTLTARAFFNVPEGTAVTKNQRNAGKCVHPSTLIYVDKKLAPIETLPVSPTEDEFLSVSHTTYDGSRQRQLSATYNGGVKFLLHVVTTGGILTCTPEHRFQMRTGKFVRAGDLKEGDLLREVSLPQVGSGRYPSLSLSLWDGIPPSQFQLSHDMAYFAGLYAGDGTGSASSVCLTHGDPEKEDAYGNLYANWVQSLEASCVACGFTTTRKDFASLYLGSRVFVKYLQALGMHSKRSKNLRIPPWVLAAGKTALLHYFGGLLDTDGTVGEGHSLDWTTKDFVFGGQVVAAMRSCGLDLNVELTFNRTYQRYYVRQRLTVESSWQMRHYMKHAGKLSRLWEPKNSGRTKDRFIVSKILPAGEHPCVDVTVKPNHIYVANGIATHNTANFALVYGGGVQAVRRATGVDKHEAARQKAAFDKSVPKFTRWLKGQHETVKKNLGIQTVYQRWIAIPDANLKAGGTFLTSNGKEMPVDVMMAKKIQASCERKAVNFPIQGAGADIMKISLTRLTKELCKKGWLRLRGGDDSVRMLMTVHDEIVFEVRHDRLDEAVPLICTTMESPTKANWKVKLIVDPLIGLDWSAKYDWIKIKSGEKPVPEWLEGIVKPGEAPAHEETKQPSTPKTPVPPPPALVENAPTPERVVKALSGEKDTRVVVFSLSTIHMGTHSTRIVTAACYLAWDDNGKLLRLTDETGNTLINPSVGIRVDPVLFGHELRSRNLGPGRYEIVDE